MVTTGSREEPGHSIIPNSKAIIRGILNSATGRPSIADGLASAPILLPHRGHRLLSRPLTVHTTCTVKVTIKANMA